MAKITKRHFVVKIGKFKIYRCPVCSCNELKISFDYCPFCGEKLEFEVLES